jgi:hypothetical protein
MAAPTVLAGTIDSGPNQTIKSGTVSQFTAWLLRMNSGEPVSTSFRGTLSTENSASRSYVSRFALQHGDAVGETEIGGLAPRVGDSLLSVISAKTREQLSMPAAHCYWLPLSSGPPICVRNPDRHPTKIMERCGAAGSWQTAESGVENSLCSLASNEYAIAASSDSVLRDGSKAQASSALREGTRTSADVDNGVSGEPRLWESAKVFCDRTHSKLI